MLNLRAVATLLLLTLFLCPAYAAGKKTRGTSSTRTAPPAATEPAPESVPETAPAPAGPPPEASRPAVSPSAGPKVASSDRAVAVFGVSVGEDEAARVAASLAEIRLAASLESQGLELVNLEAHFPPSPPASIKEGERMVQEGRQAYDNLDPDAAVAKFSDASIYFLKHPQETPARTLANAFIFLGSAHLLGGNKADAKSVFERAVLADPSARPESDLLGPEVVELFVSTRAALLARPGGSLSIESSPAGAKVYLHGEAVGRTPLRDVPLAPGRHQVVLTRPGYEPYGAFPEVRADRKGEIRPSLDPAPGFEAVLVKARSLASPYVGVSVQASPEAQAVAQSVGARYVVIARIPEGPVSDKTQAEVEVWDVVRGHRLKGIKLVTGEDSTYSSAASEISRWIGNGPATAHSSSFKVPEFAKRWWFWAALGGVAAATTAGVMVGTGAIGTRPPNLVLGLP